MKKMISLLAVFIIVANTLFAQPQKRKTPASKGEVSIETAEWQNASGNTKLKANQQKNGAQTQTVVAPRDQSSGLKPKQRGVKNHPAG